ncbi:MAG: hypothetical protein D6722_00080 [Bacteroidetes bacterium]|nr:MAG: hypothetical protein D6722_00080 [Bacteroidota bacterium]
MAPKYLGLALFLFIGLPMAFAQDLSLEAINSQRLQLNKANMYVLGGWAVGNMAVSGYLRGRTTGNTRYFHEMNVFWNVVNLGLAAGGLYGSYTTDPASLDLYATFSEQQKLEKILLFNMALNFTYLTAGGYLIERSKTATNRPERLKGYGQSLLLQGGFLLVFDVTQFLLHHYRAAPHLEQWLRHVAVTGQGVGVVVPF